MVMRGFFVGRFQPFHLGHLRAITTILSEVDELIIAIGSTQSSHDLDNPFTAGVRLVMIRKALEESRVDCNQIWVVYVPDVQLHATWVSVVQYYSPKFEAVYSNDPLTQRLFLEAEYVVKPIRLYKRRIYSSTEIRERMRKDKSWKKLVPKSVERLIKIADGVRRLKDLAKSDKH